MTQHISDANNSHSFKKTFTAAPHRMMFFSGIIQILIPLLVWTLELAGRHSNLFSTLDTIIPSTWAHGFIMLYGVVIFFIFGFLMTTYPRWMNGSLISKPQYIICFNWMTLGIIIFEIGLFSNFTLLTSGLLMFIFGWLQGILALYNVYKHAPAKDKSYETILNASLIAGLSEIGRAHV